MGYFCRPGFFVRIVGYDNRVSFPPVADLGGQVVAVRIEGVGLFPDLVELDQGGVDRLAITEDPFAGGGILVCGGSTHRSRKVGSLSNRQDCGRGLGQAG